MHCFKSNKHDTNWKQETQVLIESLNIFGAQNQLPISFGTTLVLNKLLKDINSRCTHDFL